MREQELIQAAQEILSLAESDPLYAPLADSCSDLIDTLSTPGMRASYPIELPRPTEPVTLPNNKPDEGPSNSEAKAAVQPRQEQ